MRDRWPIVARDRASTSVLVEPLICVQLRKLMEMEVAAVQRGYYFQRYRFTSPRPRQ